MKLVKYLIFFFLLTNLSMNMRAWKQFPTDRSGLTTVLNKPNFFITTITNLYQNFPLTEKQGLFLAGILATYSFYNIGLESWYNDRYNTITFIADKSRPLISDQQNLIIKKKEKHLENILNEFKERAQTFEQKLAVQTQNFRKNLEQNNFTDVDRQINDFQNKKRNKFIKKNEETRSKANTKINDEFKKEIEHFEKEYNQKLEEHYQKTAQPQYRNLETKRAVYAAILGSTLTVVAKAAYDYFKN